MRTLSKVKFLPWVGEKYGFNGIFGRKIMILGQSHYGACPAEDEKQFTNEVMKKYLGSDKTVSSLRTFKVFERSLYGNKTNRSERQSIWESLIFYNYVQKFVAESAGVAPKKKDYKESEEAFFQVLEEYKPEFVIVWGTSTWYNLPYTNWEEGEKVIIDEYNVFNGYYTLNNGHTVKMICVKHPSYGYSWSFWNKVLNHFDLTVNSIDNRQFNQELNMVKEKSSEIFDILRSANGIDDCLNKISKGLGVSSYIADYIVNMSFKDLANLV